MPGQAGGGGGPQAPEVTVGRQRGWGCEAKNRLRGLGHPDSSPPAGWGKAGEQGSHGHCSPLESPLPRVWPDAVPAAADPDASLAGWGSPGGSCNGAEVQRLQQGQPVLLPAGPGSGGARQRAGVQPWSRGQVPAPSSVTQQRVAPGHSHVWVPVPCPGGLTALRGHVGDGRAQVSVRPGARTCERAYCSPDMRPQASWSPASLRLPACEVGAIALTAGTGAGGCHRRAEPGGQEHLGRHCWLAALRSWATRSPATAGLQGGPGEGGGRRGMDPTADRLGRVSGLG